MKTAVEAKKELPKQTTPSKLSKQTAEDLDHVPSPGRIREVTPTTSREVTASDSNNACTNGQKYKNSNNNGSGYSDRYVGSNYMQATDRYVQEGNGHVSPLRHTPTKDRGGGDDIHYRSRSGQGRDRSEDGCNGNRNGNGARHTPTKDDHFRGRVNSGKPIFFSF